MDTFVDILALCIMAAAVGFVSAATVGAGKIFAACARARLNAERRILDGNPYGEVGISVIIYGRQSPHQVERRLSYKYAHYEAILVTDFETDPFCRDVLKKYSMMKVDWTPTAGFVSDRIRAVYRSRQRRYRRLVLVDHKTTCISCGFNCGISVASYDRVLCLDRLTFLYPEALGIINNEYCERPADRNDALCAIRLTEVENSPLGVIDVTLKSALFGAGFGTTSLRGERIAETAFVAREKVIEAGGYADDFYPEAELLRRMKVTARADGTKFKAVNIPLIIGGNEFSVIDSRDPADGCLASDEVPAAPGETPTADESSPCRPVPAEWKGTRRFAGFPRRAIALFWLAVLGSAVWAIAAGEVSALKKCILIFFTGYLSTVAAASVSLTAYGRLFPRSSRAGIRISPYLVFNTLLYPFYRLHYTISHKNFPEQ